jgi:hypothetical protein
VDRVTFDDADLTNVNFRNAVITGTTFVNTTLTGATFEESLIGKVRPRLARFPNPNAKFTAPCVSSTAVVKGSYYVQHKRTVSGPITRTSALRPARLLGPQSPIQHTHGLAD